MPNDGQICFTYFLRVGVGAQQGHGIDTAQGVSDSGAGQGLSNTNRVQVKVTGGVFSNDACVLGKVFVDCNNHMLQDCQELGIPGIRLYLQDGTAITTDSEGKYSCCGLPPRTQVLRIDALTLPRWSRLLTSSSRNAGDASWLLLDPKNGVLQRGDFIEGSCSNSVLEQVKVRRAQGEMRVAESEAAGTPALKFEGRSPGGPNRRRLYRSCPLRRRTPSASEYGHNDCSAFPQSSSTESFKITDFPARGGEGPSPDNPAARTRLINNAVQRRRDL